MSSYASGFEYLGKKSEDMNVVISHFDSDIGEMDSYLTQNQIYSDSYNGVKRNVYGVKWGNVVNIKITIIKKDGGNFSVEETRNVYKWITGNKNPSWLKIYINKEEKYRFMCTNQDVKPQKMDGRIIGFHLYFESISPFSYSPLQTINKKISGNATISIDCPSDDLYEAIPLKVTYTNQSGSELSISNSNFGNPTKVTGLSVNEKIILNNSFIISDKPNKVFGENFNFIFPKIISGTNTLNVKGNGDLVIEYCYPIKIGDGAVTINEERSSICEEQF